MPTNKKECALAVETLSPRQKQVLGLLASGKQAKEIAEVLAISNGRVRQIIEAIYLRLGVHNKVEATRVAFTAEIL